MKVVRKELQQTLGCVQDLSELEKNFKIASFTYMIRSFVESITLCLQN